MWQDLRDYWLPMLLFIGALLAAAILILLVATLPFAGEYLPFENPILSLFAEDATVQRVSIAAAIGLVVTAFVFFRPNSAPPERKSSPGKPPRDTMAGA
jgi:hypothetical protein